MNGWVNLGDLIGSVKIDSLIGKKVRAVDESDGWAGVSKGDVGILKSVGWSGKAAASFSAYKNGWWKGVYACFEVLMSDEEDIL